MVTNIPLEKWSIGDSRTDDLHYHILNKLLGLNRNIDSSPGWQLQIPFSNLFDLLWRKKSAQGQKKSVSEIEMKGKGICFYV